MKDTAWNRSNAEEDDTQHNVDSMQVLRAFLRNRKKSKLHRPSQETLNKPNDLEGEEQNWRNHTCDFKTY